MGKIIVSEFMSLDGVIEAPETWHFPYISDDMQAFVNADILESDAALLGRVTYEAFAPFWSTLTQNEYGIADKLNTQPKFVVSTTLQKVEWNNSTLIKGNLAAEIAKVKQQISGNIGLTGSATLVQSLMQADLIDEYHLLVHPIVVGKGKRLFKDGMDTAKLKLVKSIPFAGGVIALVYQPADQAS
jgi:dihydrofolate reductase